jgi:asparagine synthase (glutamine-hydrolysing)
MCSIAGLVQKTRGENISRSAVERMNAALHHRGPDDLGQVTISTNGNQPLSVVLGNTRLAIIDLSAAGHQPMCDPDTGNWITYNGETYNFRELRNEIGDEFGPWRSNTDTEVVLRAYRKWGVEAFARLRGMFALAIWDSGKEELLLARDRFGIKPLYYFTDKKQVSLLFASEIRALLASELVPRRLCTRAVRSYLEFGSIQAPLTIIDNVTSLKPGHCLRVRNNATSSSLSFELSQLEPFSATPQSAPSSKSEAIAALRKLLEDSVLAHLVSDVPIGVFLSGGMDSSALVALMSRISSEVPKTFSVIFNEQQFNEASHSQFIANKFGTDHREIRLNESTLLDTLPNALAAIDQPTMDGINTFVVAKAVKNAGVTVALSGLGGDELFGGYPSFGRAIRLNSTGSLVRTALRTIAPIGQLVQSNSTQQKKLWQLASSDITASEIYRITRQLFAPSDVESLSIKHTTELSQTYENGHSDVFNAISKMEIEGYMANTLLRDTDSMSMAHSLEVRVPFVDPVVVDFVLNLPGEWKVNGNGASQPKPFLAETLGDLLPAEFLNRKKMGFTLPFEKWICGTLQQEISAIFNDQELLENAGISKDAAKEVFESFKRRPRAVGWSRPWSIYVLAKWCDLNHVTI